jgi:hypothetical protein
MMYNIVVAEVVVGLGAYVTAVTWRHSDSDSGKKRLFFDCCNLQKKWVFHSCMAHHTLRKTHSTAHS